MSVATPPTAQEHLLHLLRQNRVYEFLPRAELHLSRCPDDRSMRLLAVREYLKLGLTAPARSLLDGPHGFLDSDLADIGRRLSGLASGATPWSDRAGVFTENLAALGSRVNLSPVSDLPDRLRAAWSRRGDDFELYIDAGRVMHVRMRGGEGWRWIPFFGDHRALAAAHPLPEGVGGNFPGPYLFEGLDLGFFLERVFRETLRTFLNFSCALYVVEPDPALIALVLHLHDWRELLRDERILWFVGPDGAARLAEAWTSDLNLPTPVQAYTMNAFRPPPAPRAVHVAQCEAARRDAAMEHSREEMQRRYAGRDVHYWARRFDEACCGRGQPLTLVAGVSMHTTFLRYSMEDTRRAVEALGHRMIVLTERRPFEVVHPLHYHDTLRAHDADLFFSIDHLRPEFGNLLPENLPLLTWDQDGLPQVVTRENIAGIAPHDFVVGSTKMRFVAEGCRPEQYLSSCIPTCPERFSGADLSGEELRRFACDVSYVSHASQTPRAFHEEERARPEYQGLRPLLDALYEILPSYLRDYGVVRGALPAAALADAEQRTGLRAADPALRARIQGWYLWRLGDRLFRHEALHWVADWATARGCTFRIHGNGWERHPTLARFAAGPVDNGRELLCLYRASRINLQLMPAGFLHQRALDGLAAGGFFLARRTPQDKLGAAYRRLAALIRERSILSNAALFEIQNPEIQHLLRLCLGAHAAILRDDPMDLTRLIPVMADETYAQESFPGFEEIAFDTPGEWAAAADRFLGDEHARRSRTDAMRDVVLARFAYRPTIERFLHALRDHLVRAACESSVQAKPLPPPNR